MVAVILILTLAFTGLLTAAFMAGGTEKRKGASLWSAVGVVSAASAGGALFFCKDAVREIILRKNPHLSFMAETIVIPWQVMLGLGMTVFSCGIILFLWSYNCRKNSSKWYWALLWSIGIVFLTSHLLFLPQYCGIAAWVNFSAAEKRDVLLPAVYIMLSVNLLGALLWLRHTLKTEKHSWKNILTFAGCFTGFVCVLWLSAWGAGTWAKNAVDAKAAELGVTPCRVADEEPPESESAGERDFYCKHSKYNPPRSGKYDWRKDAVPADEKEYTMKFFSSPELEAHLAGLKKSAARTAGKDVLYLPALWYLRSLVRHRADIAELYFRTGKNEKVLPELLKCPELEAMIPEDTPFLICELVRTATRAIWVDALVKYGPEDVSYLPDYRKLLARSGNWQVHLPGEAGCFLTVPPENNGAIAAFFCAPCLNTARYRGFFDAVDRLPELKKLERREVISGDGMFAAAAKRQRLGIVMGQTALALKCYRVEHGEYPQNLSELVPRYLPREHVSPYSGEKLTYALENGVFTLISDRSEITSER